jgi:AcrR family transcriptional regulator
MAVTERAHRREELLKAAAGLFSRRGYHGTSMGDLADSMGILRGSLYSHINSKEDLLFDIVDQGADRFITRMEEVVASEDPPTDKVRLAIEAHVTTVAEHLDASTVFLNEWRYLSGDKLDTIQAKRDLYESLISEIVEEGIEWGAFPEELDPKFATLLILSVVNWLYQWYDPEGEKSLEQIVEIFTALLLGGLKGA